MLVHKPEKLGAVWGDAQTTALTCMKHHLERSLPMERHGTVCHVSSIWCDFTMSNMWNIGVKKKQTNYYTAPQFLWDLICFNQV